MEAGRLKKREKQDHSRKGLSAAPSYLVLVVFAGVGADGDGGVAVQVVELDLGVVDVQGAVVPRAHQHVLIPPVVLVVLVVHDVVPGEGRERGE